jgi:hypothetical protein
LAVTAASVTRTTWHTVARTCLAEERQIRVIC